MSQKTYCHNRLVSTSDLASAWYQRFWRHCLHGPILHVLCNGVSGCSQHRCQAYDVTHYRIRTPHTSSLILEPSKQLLETFIPSSPPKLRSHTGMQVGDATNLHEPIYIRVTFQLKCLDLSLTRLSFTMPQAFETANSLDFEILVSKKEHFCCSSGANNQ